MEKGNLVVEGKKDSSMIVNMSIVGWHNGPSPTWSISEDTEVSNVTFENGLLVVTLTRVVPETGRAAFSWVVNDK